MKQKPTYGELEKRIQELEEIIQRNKHLRYYIKVKDFEEAARIGYQTLFSEAIIPIFLIDPADNLIIDVNQATEQLTGYERSELVGSHISKIIQEDKSAANLLMKHVEQKADLRQFNTIIVTKDKKEKIIDTNYSFYNYLGKKLIQVIGVDITDRRLAELAQDKRERELNRLNTAKNMFFSIIGHDLKSPFNSMLGFADILLESFDELDPPLQKQYIGYIHESLLNTYKTLDNLLLWSRSQMDHIEFKLQKLNLFALASEIIKLFKFSLSKKNIRVFNQVPEQLNVYADKDMLSSVIRNLISNAVKFTPEKGKIHITTRLLVGERKKRFIEVKVRDNGVGISAGTQSKLFNIEDKTSTRGTQNEPGTGLGLAICRDFVVKLGGQIRIESELGKGASFIFTVPCFE